MTDQPRPTSVALGVVVPTVRDLGEAMPAFDALHASLQATGQRAEVAVVDDRPVRQDLRRHVEQLGFRYMTTAGATGPGNARNVGAAALRGDWLLFVDDDVVVDTGTIGHAQQLARCGARRAVIGGLRPPGTELRWLRWACEDLSMNASSAFAPEGPIPASHLCSSLLLMERALFDAAGRFPPIPTWEDVVLGLRAGRLEPDFGFRDHGLSGVHLNVPEDWPAWLQRQASAGARLAALQQEVASEDAVAVVRAMNLEDGVRAHVKRALTLAPASWWRHARGRHLRRLAASAAFAHGFHAAARTPSA